MRRDPRRGHRLPNWLIGLVLVAVLAIGSYLAFAKQVPWGDAYEVRAVFASSQNLRPDSPVRIAGVNVGTVTEVEHLSSATEPELTAATGARASAPSEATVGEQAAIVTMELTEEARPVRSDATFKLRPRLFLEGNLFVDLKPGSPSAPEVGDGHTFPVNQTAYSVQIDQILTTLQSDVRRDLQVFLDQFGNALIKHGGAEGLREFYRTSAGANRYTAEVNEALLGTERGDLGNLVKGLDRVVRGLGRDEQRLQQFVTNFRVFTGSFAAQDDAVAETIERLPAVLRSADPAFRNLNASFPALRSFAREALPGTRSSDETLRVATPFIEQVRKLVSERELRGLVAELRPTIPRLVDLARGNLGFLEQSRALSSCFNEVVIPWSNDTVDPVDPNDVYPHEPGGRVYEETAYGLSGIASESRSGDANGQYIRVMAGSGSNMVEIPELGGMQDLFGLTPFPILGAMPRIEDSAKPRFRPDRPCERQEPPDLGATIADPPSQQPVPSSAIGLDALSGEGGERLREYAELLTQLGQVEQMRADGENAAADRLVARAERVLGRLGVGADLDQLGGRR